jgi:general secretion pathway protein D
MQLTNRPIRTALALAVCQLLLACAQPAKNNFVSHFRDDTRQSDYVFLPDDEADAAKGKKSESADSAKPRILDGTGKLLAEAKSFPAVEGKPVKLNFEDAPLSQVVRTVLGDILSLDYVLHPPITGNITLSTRSTIPADQALNLLETALQANGLAMVRDARGTYHVGRVDALKSIGATVRQAVSDKPLAPGYGTIIVPLQYIGANEMAAILRPMVPGDAILRVDNIRNLLVMAGSRAQAEGWLDMVRTFDVNLLEGMSVGVFPLKYVSIQEVSAALQIMNGGAGAGGAAAPGVAPGAASAVRPGAVGTGAIAGGAGASGGATALTEGNPLFGALRIMPIERLNSILVITPRAAYLDEARRWIAKLDQPGSGGSQPQLNIYRVQNGNARHLAGVLAGIFGGAMAGATANSGVAPGLGTSTSGSGFGNNSFGNSGFGNSSFGNSGFGSNSGFGNSGFGGSGFGNSGFGNSGFGGSNFGSGQRVSSNTGFGQSGTMGQPGSQGAVGANLGSIRVMADELNNTVLVWGTPAEFERIESTLKKLDLPPTQVLIEASIVEVTLNDTLRYGLQWAFSGDVGNKGYSGNGGLLSAGGEKPPPGAAGMNSAGQLTEDAITLGQGFNYTLKNSLGNIKAVLTALAGKTQVKVVASPTVTVLDNHTAAISVGTQQPYQAGSTSAVNVGTSINYQYKDTGVNLQVTPSVNAGNLVTMTVNQSVTDVGGKDEVTQQRSFLQRQISSRVAVRSGESIVMGGLIQENSSEGRSGIPYLYDLPVVGNLFGSTNNSGARTELIVIITPRVVRTDIDLREVSDDLRERMRSLAPLLKTPSSVEVGPLTPAVP